MSFLIGPGALGVVGVIKLYLEENFDFQKIWNWKQVCSDVWTCTKMLEQWSQFLSKTVLFNSLLLLKWPTYSCCWKGIATQIIGSWMNVRPWSDTKVRGMVIINHQNIGFGNFWRISWCTNWDLLNDKKVDRKLNFSHRKNDFKSML